MKNLIMIILATAMFTQSALAFEDASHNMSGFIEAVSDTAGHDKSPVQMTWSLTMLPFLPLTVTGFGVCSVLLNVTGHNGDMDGLICIAMLIPGLNLTVSANMSAEATTIQSQYSHEVQHRKELILGAQESAALFVANDGMSEIDPSLRSALEIFNIKETAQLSDLEKAQLVLMAPGIF